MKIPSEENKNSVIISYDHFLTVQDDKSRYSTNFVPKTNTSRRTYARISFHCNGYTPGIYHQAFSDVSDTINDSRPTWNNLARWVIHLCLTHLVRIYKKKQKTRETVKKINKVNRTESVKQKNARLKRQQVEKNSRTFQAKSCKHMIGFLLC